MEVGAAAHHLPGPAFLRESSQTSYEPRMVSIGPYYHGASALRAMEDHKWRYLHDLLSRSGGAGVAVVTASALVAEMREHPIGLNTDDFVRMLLLDGCFILEFFFKWHTKQPDALCNVGWGLTL
uniref:Uncharacterized protein n=1 Tax=Oryza punctata TaxID=4537 RepID=A0A0E0JK72_ORYPU